MPFLALVRRPNSFPALRYARCEKRSVTKCEGHDLRGYTSGPLIEVALPAPSVKHEPPSETSKKKLVDVTKGRFIATGMAVRAGLVRIAILPRRRDPARPDLDEP